MKRMKAGNRFAAWLLVLVMVLSLLPVQVFAAENDLSTKLQNFAATADSDYDGYIVKMKPSARVSLFSARKAELEVVSKDSNLYYADSIEQIENTVPLSEIECVEPNYKLQLLDSAANDTLYANGVQWNLDAMKVPAAWSKGQYGAGITVAVIDSGLFGVGSGEIHEDIDPAKVVKQYNFLDDNTDVTDTKGHGTYVAGSIFAKTNNGAGIAGIMPEVNIMPLKVFGSGEAENSAVIAAIDYAVKNGADVINMSLGGKNNSELLRQACDDATKAGVLVVAAAGNDGTSDLIYPAAYDSVIGVAALTKSNELYENSQYGESVFVAAPGDGIVCVDNKTNQYCSKTGTSLAAPEVAALGAMAKSIKRNINQDGFKELIKQTSTDLGEKGFDSFFGWGAINFEAAANKLLGTETKEHTYGQWRSNGDTTHSRECTDEGCGHKETALHTWDNGVVGEKSITYTCTVCGQTKVSTNPISDVWEYEVIGEGKAVKLTKYIGTQTNVIVPSALDVDGKKLPVTTIGNATFKESTVFRVEFPESITKVEDGNASSIGGVVGTFAFCKNLSVVKLSSKMSKIADYMFYGAGSNYRLELTISDGIAEIGDSAFSMCNTLPELTLPASVKKIGNSAFYQSRRLATLNMPGVTTVEADAFSETVFEESYENKWKAGEFTGIAYAGKVAYLYFGPYTGSQDSKKYDPSNMPKDTELVLEDGTLGISEFLFSSHYVNRDSCKNNLKSITVPETIKYIPSGFFKGFGAVQEPDFKGMDMYGFAGTDAQTYAAANDNIRFHPIATGEKPGYDSVWYDKHKSENSFLINTAAELWCFNDIVGIGEVNFEGKTVKIGKDLDLGGLTASGYGMAANRWDALGNFKGTLDGQGHTISGIYVKSEQDNQGLFGELGNTCTIKDLHLKGKVAGRDYVGGIVGKSVGATITGCSFDGTVTGGGQYGYVGGIAGFASGKFGNCKVSGAVTSKLNTINNNLLTGATGGIVGYMGSCTIEKCENNATITGNAYSIGGIVGQMLAEARTSDCTNNGAVNGMQFVGGVVGRVTAKGERLVIGCVNNGTITGTTYVGGIIGTIAGHGASAEECANKGSVKAKDYAAGILGYSEAGLIRKCYNTADITASYSAAGIIAKDSGFGVEDSYNLGNITATKDHAGGITAFANNANDEGNMVNCYNIGKVSADSDANPLGNVYNNGDIFKNCYYLAEKESTAVPNRTAKTAATFKTGEVAYRLGSNYGQTIGVDLNPVFKTKDNAVLTDGTTYFNEGSSPIHSHSYSAWASDGEVNHRRSCNCGKTETAAHTWNGGVITKPATQTETGAKTYTCTACGETRMEVIPIIDDKTVRISTLEDLQNFARRVDGVRKNQDEYVGNYAGKTVLLTADIDASGVDWNPAGYYISTQDFKDFAGIFDGQGHTVTINASDTSASYYGFLAVNGGIIKNLIVAGTVSAKGYVGSVAGQNKGTIENCTNKATVTGSASSIGGITGNGAAGSKVKNCANAGNVTGAEAASMYVAGIVGNAVGNTEISGCYNTGAISGAKGSLGGVAGYALGDVHNCYNSGAVDAKIEKSTSKTFGGVVGWLYGAGNIKNCYNIGTVTAPNTGAIAGTADTGKLTNSYYLEYSASYGFCNLSSKTFTDGVKTADEMKKVASEAAFKDAFKADYTGKAALNNGYPILKWQLAHEHSYGAWSSNGEANHKRTCGCGETETEAHTWNVGVVTKATTETETGVKTYTCTVCGEIKTEIIPIHVHSYGKWISDGAINHKHTCSCGKTETAAHTWNGGVVTTPATATAAGIKTYACTVCGATKTETIPVTVNPNPVQPSQPDVGVKVNGQERDAGTASTTKTNGQSVLTYKFDDEKLTKILNASGEKPKVTLPVSNNSNVVVGELSGQLIKSLEAKSATLEIKTQTVSYTLPASQINIDAVSSQLGSQVALKDIKVSVKIGEASTDTVRIVTDTAAKNGLQIVVKPVEFEITCTSGDKTVHVNKFNAYVERMVAMPDGIDPSKITTGIVLNSDGTFRHVPTSLVMINGKYFAKINSLTNSTYSVIWNPVSFADTQTHWAQTAINDMGARMIVSGVGNGKYEPDRSITRAEFAAIVVRAMGLAQGTAESSFKDVSLSDWFNGYVDTATGYGLITGYSAEAYGPNDTITREQAMTIIARAIKLTELSASTTDSEIGTPLSKYTDGDAVSDFAKEGVSACLKSGVINGSSATTLSPKANVTRAEVAIMVQRLLQKSGLI